MKKPQIITVRLDKIVGGGQAMGTLDDGRKIFVWGGLPDETVAVRITKKKSRMLEGAVTEVTQPSPHRITPQDAESYISTSPWQIMDFDTEQHYKAALIEEAFELHDIVLPHPITIFSDGKQYGYRNKIEYSFWWETETLSLAFFRRGTHGKITIQHTSLASPAITNASQDILNTLNQMNIQGRSLKTLLIRSDQEGNVAWQLYVKDESFPAELFLDAVDTPAVCGEVIYSNPQSPASVITKRLAATSDQTLSDTLLDVPFGYATEGFFQINLPVYEQALKDIKAWVQHDKPLVDMYSGVGTIGITVGNKEVQLVEINEHAVREMQRNITQLGRTSEVSAVLAPSEKALEHISANACIVVDPPRAGLHEDVIHRLLEVRPARIIYLSCNPVTQARDVARLATAYGIRHHQGYNFFPRTPHIENLVVLDLVAPATV